MKQSNRLVILSLVILSAASAARADLQCPEFTPRPFSTIETQIDLGDEIILKGKHIDCKKVGIAAEVVSDISKMVGPELASPPRLAFRMVDTFDNAFFNPGDISLNVPYQIVMDDYAKNPVYTIPVWAHEYGHAIFEENLGRAAQKWQGFIRHRMAGKRLLVGKKALDPNDILGAMLLSYNEFFADVIAVMYTGKGDSVARGLAMTGWIANPEGRPSVCPNSDPRCRPRNRKVDLKELLVSRDFTSRANQLDHWRGVDPNDGHNVLAATRYHIWKYYLSNPALKRKTGLLASVTLDAIVADVNRRLQRMAGDDGIIQYNELVEEMSDTVRINREFIQTLDSYMVPLERDVQAGNHGR